jgi:hypothetical protein
MRLEYFNPGGSVRAWKSQRHYIIFRSNLECNEINSPNVSEFHKRLEKGREKNLCRNVTKRVTFKSSSGSHERNIDLLSPGKDVLIIMTVLKV